MRQSTFVTLVLLRWILCFSFVNAQAAVFGVSTSMNPSICAPVNITWSGGTPPFTPRINVGDQRQLLPEVPARTALWLPEVAEDVTITILDSAGRQSTSGSISISDDCPSSTQSSSSTSQPTSSPTAPVAQSTSRDPEALIIGLATGLSILFTLSLLTLFIICRRRQRRNAKKSGWAVIRPGKTTPGWEDVSLPADLESKGHDNEPSAGGDMERGRVDSLNPEDKTSLRIIPPLPAPFHARFDSVTSAGESSRHTPRSFDGLQMRPLGSSGDSTNTGRRTLRFIPPAAPPPSPSASWQEPPSPTGSFGTTRSSILIHDRHSDIWTFDRNPFVALGEDENQDLPTRLSDLLLLEAQRAPRASPDAADHPSL